MPNHCYIEFTISGPRVDIYRLRERIRKNEHGHYCLFDSLLPMPDALEGTQYPSPLETGIIADKRDRQVTTSVRNRA